jgi:hypothetical protein
MLTADATPRSAGQGGGFAGVRSWDGSAALDAGADPGVPSSCPALARRVLDHFPESSDHARWSRTVTDLVMTDLRGLFL